MGSRFSNSEKNASKEESLASFESLRTNYESRFTRDQSAPSTKVAWKSTEGTQRFEEPQYVIQARPLPPSSPDSVRFVAISDTHGLHDKPASVLHDLPDGDVLLHAGDFSNKGTRKDLEKFVEFLALTSRKYKEVIFIAGNHDITLDPLFYKTEWNRFHKRQLTEEESRGWFLEEIKRYPNVIYLEDSAHTTLGGLWVYGSPWQPTFHRWSFNVDRGQPCRVLWERIPNKTDVLLTHGPPLGRGDKCFPLGFLAGCVDLLGEVQNRIKPDVHVFGHIHEGSGCSSDGTTDFINASTCTFAYRPTNSPVIFDLASKKDGTS